MRWSALLPATAVLNLGEDSGKLVILSVPGFDPWTMRYTPEVSERLLAIYERYKAKTIEECASKATS